MGAGAAANARLAPERVISFHRGPLVLLGSGALSKPTPGSRPGTRRPPEREDSEFRFLLSGRLSPKGGGPRLLKETPITAAVCGHSGGPIVPGGYLLVYCKSKVDAPCWPPYLEAKPDSNHYQAWMGRADCLYRAPGGEPFLIALHAKPDITRTQLEDTLPKPADIRWLDPRTRKRHILWSRDVRNRCRLYPSAIRITKSHRKLVTEFASGFDFREGRLQGMFRYLEPDHLQWWVLLKHPEPTTSPS